MLFLPESTTATHSSSLSPRSSVMPSQDFSLGRTDGPLWQPYFVPFTIKPLHILPIYTLTLDRSPANRRADIQRQTTARINWNMRTPHRKAPRVGSNREPCCCHPLHHRAARQLVQRHQHIDCGHSTSHSVELIDIISGSTRQRAAAALTDDWGLRPAVLLWLKKCKGP